MTMEINEALNIARQLKNHFRAFEKIDELVNEGAALQNVMAEFESKKAAIQEEIAALRELKEREGAHVKTMELMAAEEAEARKRLDAIKDEIRRIKMKLQ